MTVKILIGADICPTSTNYDLFAQADLQALVGEELSSLLKSADYTIFNLETPLVDHISPINKVGPLVAAPTRTIPGLKSINSHFFTLANNHILDQGVQGLKSTEHVLKQAGISYAGVGDNSDQASQPYRVVIKGVKLGIYCCAEHEFSIATSHTPGANAYDPLVSFDAVRELKKQCDFVVVLYHGGREHYCYPSPQLQRVLRKFAQCGADVVLAQHTHCIGCAEDYRGSKLIYGQGNFLFDRSESEYWQTNLLVELTCQGKELSVNYIPCVKHGNGVRLAKEPQAQQILADFETRSKQIQEPGFVEQQYRLLARDLLNSYLRSCSGWFGYTFLARVFNKLSKHHLFEWFYSQRGLLRVKNVLTCEAHREAFLQAIKEKIK